MFETKNDLPLGTRTKVVKPLNERLADAIDLGTQTKHAHWNVKGPNFIAPHELLDQVAESLEDHIGTLAAVATSLKPYPENINEGAAHLKALSAALAAFGAKVRTAIEESGRLGDADTADLFTGISRDLDQQPCFLEAHLHAQR
jgi:starvation-inducible DNA-binding protein